MSKFNIFTIDLRVILLIIVATGVYTLLLKFLQKNSPHRCSNERGGVKGFLNNVNCTFLIRRLPLPAPHRPGPAFLRCPQSAGKIRISIVLMKNLTLPIIAGRRKTVLIVFTFLAVQDSSIGDLVSH